MAKLQYHGWLGAAVIPAYTASFLVTVFTGGDTTDFSLRLGVAVLLTGALLAVAGFGLNKGVAAKSASRSRFSAPHLLAYVPVQHLGVVGCVAGIGLMLVDFL